MWSAAVASGHDDDMGAGTLLDYPRARWHRDGGSGDFLGVEAITVANYPKTRYPYYLRLYPNGFYDFLLRDYNNGADLNDAEPIVRIWNSGRYYYAVEKTDDCDPGENWWGATWINRNGTSPWYWNWDTCGIGDTYNNDPDGLWAYAEGGAIVSANHGR